MKISITSLFYILTFYCYSQVPYFICKIDSVSQRIFICTDTATLNNIANAKIIISKIEGEYQSFRDLSISFFDSKEECGYQIESVAMSKDSLVDIKVNDVKNHWFAEYSKKSGEIEYYMTDGSFDIRKKRNLRKNK